ncbi:DUF1579 family protein [Arthrobacter globiformis]|uniref:DUF1579 domain-containing protein n=1 Tax=Arthrobacter globiformis TaxID=1665 RepID=A0A328HCW8_ARTGO|nr:DUF1579 family protein [Arthrobacter globiformis]RAM36428.1 DUF1579 domain-containing protein [Arthrobacter globiformis]
MDQPPPGTAHEALEIFVGRWLGTTELAASPWGPARTATAEVTFTRAAGGFAVVQSYRHTEADGTHFEGHGVFTVDPDHDETLWYYVDSMGGPPSAPARGVWHDSTLMVERHSDRGTARHTFRVDQGVLTHTAELRLGETQEFQPFMTSICHRA